MKSDCLTPKKYNFSESKLLNKLRVFYNGKLYPLIIALAVLISHTFSIEEFGISVILLSAFCGFILCDDLKFLISPLIGFIFMFSEKRVASGVFYKKGYVIAMIIGAFILVSFIIAHFIIYRKNVHLRSFKDSKLFLGFIIFSASVLLNGCLNFDEYTSKNIIYALILVSSTAVIFFLFTINLNKNKDLVEYLLYVLFLISVLLTLELFLSFINQIQIVDGQIIKESVKVGWGMWNNIGGLMAFLLPVHFYFASTVKKIGPLFYFSGVLSFAAIILTLSRSSLLFGGLTLLICVVLTCFTGVNKRLNRIFTISLFVLGIVGIFILWGKISSVLGDYLARGLDDNGRFEMYLHGLKNFLSNPIFGGGFYSSYETDYMFIHFLPYRYHNTLIQMIATTGIIGFSSYIFHRYQTVRLLLSNKRLSTVYIALCIGTMLGASLLDNHFFNIYPAMIYSIMLVAIEKTIKE